LSVAFNMDRYDHVVELTKRCEALNLEINLSNVPIAEMKRDEVTPEYRI